MGWGREKRRSSRSRSRSRSGGGRGKGEGGSGGFQRRLSGGTHGVRSVSLELFRVAGLRARGEGKGKRTLSMTMVAILKGGTDGRELAGLGGVPDLFRFVWNRNRSFVLRARGNKGK